MLRTDARQISTEIDNRLDDVHCVTWGDLWVDLEDLPEAVRIIDSMTEVGYSPSVSVLENRDDRVSITLD